MTKIDKVARQSYPNLFDDLASNQCIDSNILVYQNVMKYRISTINTRRAHLKKLQMLNIEIHDLNNENIIEALKKLQTASNKNGKKLTVSYINIIYSTIRKLNPFLTVSASKFGFPRHNRTTLNELADNIDIIGLKRLFEIIFQYTYNFKLINSYKITSRATVDTAITMMLVVITNLRFEQLSSLRVHDLKMIAASKTTSILINSRVSTVKVVKTTELFDPLYTCIINMILSREEFVNRQFNTDYKVDYSKNINDGCQQILVNKTNTDDFPIISCKKDSINKTIYELYVKTHERKPTISLGITLIKKMKNCLIDTIDLRLLS
ncbi:very late factor 1b-1, bracovirus particle protein [Microplitis demolitor]|uniref:very late factor 1b-1, bracovirus particle protein n=1 Tax=Microplitis demolitor TaxID=69319 RepID=UPI0004400079|nr:very late factor 1b-1, bracovirus particle protein [Microplitis demolitor]KAG6558479.1 very late factor 1b-1, bracovirus particle protein [Microplitis demolitor]